MRLIRNNLKTIIGFSALFFVCVGLTTAFANDAPSENASARAALILGSQEAITTVDTKLRALKLERAALDQKIEAEEQVRKSLDKNMNADISAVEDEGWTWDFENKKLIPFEGSPKAQDQ